MSFEVLHQLASSDKAWAAGRAQIALDLATQYHNQQLSESEYAELMQDLVRSDVLDSEADDLEIKTALVTAVYAAANLI